MKEDWAEQLRRKLEGHEVTPPDGLWERICEQMEAEGWPMGLKHEPVRQKPAINKWRWAAAAAVLALVGCFVVYEISDNEQPLQADAVPQHQTQRHQTQQQLSTNQGDRSLDSSLDAPAIPQNGSLTSHLSPLASDLSPLISDLSPLTSDQEEQQTTAVEQHEEPVEEPVEKHEEPIEQEQLPAQKVTAKEELPVPTEILDLPKAPVEQKKWSVGVNASGGLLAANNSVQTDRLYSEKVYFGSAAMFEYDSGTSHEYSSYTLTEHVAKHQLPLRLGLSLQYHLNPRWALLSGISYTRLYSEFSIPLYHNISYNQKLHYIGIPFGVAWQLWQANRFSFYFIGGAMVEKCVGVDLSGDYQGKKPWQWSVNAAAGAEFSFTPQFGVYLEPSLGYYFSDGTQLEHYYKEHPLAPSIEFGLRMHLGR